MVSPLPSHALARHGDLAWRTRGLIFDVSVSPSGRRVAAASKESLYVWDAADGAVVASPLVGAVPEMEVRRAVAVARDGSAAAFAHGGRVTVLDGATGDAVEGVVLKVAITAVALSPDGARLAAGDERGVVRVYVRPGRKPKLELVGHIGPVSALAFRDDGRLLASGADDGTTVAWDVASALAPPKRARKKP